MTPVPRHWLNRLRYLGRLRRFEVDLDDEIRFHIETRATELEESGLRPAEARAQAQREFGPIARASEDTRAAWQFQRLQDLASDIRYALRAFRRSPTFTLTAVLSLALGIGANSAIFTALDAVLWRPLPVADPGRLVGFSITRDKLPPETDLPAGFAQQLRRSNIFDGLTIETADGLSFSYDGRAERILSEVVSPNFFTLFGVEPILGQCFTPEVRNGHWAAEAVLSYDFWKQRFGGDPTVIGRTIHLNTYPFTIVGVSPPSFFGFVRGTGYELRIPILPEGQEISQLSQISGRSQGWLNAVGRLKPGVAISQAEAATDARFQEFLRTTTLRRFQNAGLRHLRLVPAARGNFEFVLPFNAPLYVLLILVGIVLLIACANVANMLLARATARSRELAVRASVGAGRVRLIRQMLAESVLLAVLGGGLGLAVAYWAAGVLFHFIPQGHINLVLNLHPDGRALFFTFAISLLTGLFFGLPPALQATRGDLAATLKADSAASIGDSRRVVFRQILVASQVAFSLVLLIAAGVFVRTLSDLRPTGFHANPERVLLFTMKPQPELYNAERRLALATELLRRVSSLPGVQSAALAENGPLGSRTSSDPVGIPGHNPIRAGSDSVSSGFFDTVGMARIAGRDFGPEDKPGSPLVAVVNQSLAKVLFPNQNALGQIVTVPTGKTDGHYTIVGVMADTHYYDVHKTPQPFIWLSIAQISPYMPTLHVRAATADTAGTIAAVRHEFDVLDKGFPVFNIRTLETRIGDSLAGERMVASLSGAFGILALALAAVGLYGVLAYSVSRRRREIGIRVALGASSQSVLWTIAREALLLVGAGSAAGVAIAVVGARIIPHYVAGVSSISPAILAACTLAMFGIAALAVSIPAARACRVEPLAALRHE